MELSSEPPKVEKALSAEDIKRFEEHLRHLNKAGDYTGALMRFEFATKDGKGWSFFDRNTVAVCTGVLRSSRNWFGKDNVFLLSYNKESPSDMGPGGLPPSNLANKVFEGGEVSMAWLKFMLDEKESPWKNTLPFIANRANVEEINSRGGFIFENLPDAPASSTFSFLMATRFAQENNRRCLLWKKVVDMGYNPRFAYIIAHAFMFQPDGKVMASSPPFHSFQMQPTKTWAKAFMNNTPREDVHIGHSGLLGVLGADKWWVDLSKPEIVATQFADRFFTLAKPTGTVEEAISVVEEFLKD